MEHRRQPFVDRNTGPQQGRVRGVRSPLHCEDVVVVREHDPNVDASFDSVSQEPSPATAWDEVASHDPHRVLSLSDRELVVSALLVECGTPQVRCRFTGSPCCPYPVSRAPFVYVRPTPVTDAVSPHRHQRVTTAQSIPMKNTIHTKSPPHPQA